MNMFVFLFILSLFLLLEEINCFLEEVDGVEFDGISGVFIKICGYRRNLT